MVLSHQDDLPAVLVQVRDAVDGVEGGVAVAVGEEGAKVGGDDLGGVEGAGEGAAARQGVVHVSFEKRSCQNTVLNG